MDDLKQKSFAVITIWVLVILIITPLKVVDSLASNVFVPAPALDIISPQNYAYSGKWAQAVPFSDLRNCFG